jgi:hypothetical protein
MAAGVALLAGYWFDPSIAHCTTKPLTCKGQGLWSSCEQFVPSACPQPGTCPDRAPSAGPARRTGDRRAAARTTRGAVKIQTIRRGH